jgi:hypothetical protein
MHYFVQAALIFLAIVVMGVAVAVVVIPKQ